MWFVFWPALVISAVWSFGRAHEQIRTACNTFAAEAGKPPSAPCVSDLVRLEELRVKNQKEATRLLKGAAIEQLSWTSRDPGGASAQHDFTIGIAEFDDQGSAWHPNQVEAVKRRLQQALEGGRTALVVVFIHGWKNNCEACNNNLACFRESLALLAAAEKTLAANLKVTPRAVFGLYIAWRGASATVEPAKELSVFGRKSAADRLGSRGGDVTNLLSWVDAVTAERGRAMAAAEAPRQLRNMVAYLGHSFGADVLFGSVAAALDAAIGMDSTTKPVTAFGDVLLLVNPAFEASAYRRFGEYARRSWPSGQLPLMLTVQARNDWATHYTFPATRVISTIGQESGATSYREMLDAVGHHPSFFTHQLGPPPAPAASAGVLQQMMPSMAAAPPASLDTLVDMMGDKRRGEKCACDHTRASDETLAGLTRSILTAVSEMPPGSGLQIGSPMNGLLSSMQPCQRPADTTPNLDSPLLVLRADPSIVDGHSGITRLEFFDFLANFIVRVDRLRSPELFTAMVGPPPAPAGPLQALPVCR